MRILLDTHTLLWMFSNSRNLSARARATPADRENTLHFSIAGYWELGIKKSIGEIELSSGWHETIPREMTRNGVNWLEIAPDHVHAASSLPWMHRDPYDRIILAQAIHEELTIVTADAAFWDYPVPVLW